MAGGKNILEGNLDDEDIIPAVTYEPSDSTEEFQVQVNKMFGNEPGSSNQNDRAGLASCEYSQISSKKVEKANEKICGKSGAGMVEDTNVNKDKGDQSPGKRTEEAELTQEGLQNLM
jgi:hypothetical protein